MAQFINGLVKHCRGGDVFFPFKFMLFWQIFFPDYLINLLKILSTRSPTLLLKLANMTATIVCF